MLIPLTVFLSLRRINFVEYYLQGSCTLKAGLKTCDRSIHGYSFKLSQNCNRTWHQRTWSTVKHCLIAKFHEHDSKTPKGMNQISISVFLGTLQLACSYWSECISRSPCQQCHIPHAPTPRPHQTNKPTSRLIISIHKCDTDMLPATDASKPAVHNFHDQTMFTCNFTYASFKQTPLTSSKDQALSSSHCTLN